MSQSYEKKRPEPPTCPYNSGVVCRVQMFCEKCNWNPEVEKKRKEGK